MSDRRKGTWDRRATILDRIDEECRPERRKDAEMRERFAELERIGIPSIGGNVEPLPRPRVSFTAGLRAMYREIRKEQKCDYALLDRCIELEGIIAEMETLRRKG